LFFAPGSLFFALCTSLLALYSLFFALYSFFISLSPQKSEFVFKKSSYFGMLTDLLFIATGNDK